MKNNLSKFIIISFLSTSIVFIFKIGELKEYIIINKNKNNLKIKSNSDNELFQLYIENREKFYIEGRKLIMKRGGIIYNESNIITFQDKLNYLLIYESPEEKTKIVDKILLRNYSKEKLGNDICPPILKIYNDTHEINLDDLPEKFILKCNHGSGMNIICENKQNFNLSEAKQKLEKWMKINYGLSTFEFQYLNVKKRIFAEKFLEDEIINYKFSCFNGEPKLIRVKGKINGTNFYNIYYTNWTSTNIKFKKKNYFLTDRFKKPINLKKMINYAKLLSSDFCYCRVDFYEVKGILYLSEITFTPFNAFIKYKKKETDILVY